MTFGKPALVSYIATELSVSKAKAQKFVDALFSGITKALKEGEEVRFSGFGTFLVRELGEREGRHPITGKPLHLPAMKRITFRAGKDMKERVNGKAMNT